MTETLNGTELKTFGLSYYTDSRELWRVTFPHTSGEYGLKFSPAISQPHPPSLPLWQFKYFGAPVFCIFHPPHHQIPSPPFPLAGCSPVFLELVCVQLLSRVRLFATSWTVAHHPHSHPQAPLFMDFSLQVYWSGLPCPPPGDLPHPGMEPRSPALQADSLPSESPGSPPSA